jgi:hypothetical protein
MHYLAGNVALRLRWRDWFLLVNFDSVSISKCKEMSVKFQLSVNVCYRSVYCPVL